MPGEPYKVTDYPAVKCRNIVWKIDTWDLITLAVTCPHCGEEFNHPVPRQYQLNVTAKETKAQETPPRHGWTAANVPDEVYCECGKDHPGRPADVPKGCGAHITGLRALFDSMFPVPVPSVRP